MHFPATQPGAVFTEPWEAQAFALAVHLVESGYFDRSEWATALGEEIKAAQARGDPDRGGTYYRHWLKALERLCTAKGLAPQDVCARTQGGVAARLPRHPARKACGASRLRPRSEGGLSIR